MGDWQREWNDEPWHLGPGELDYYGRRPRPEDEEWELRAPVELLHQPQFPPPNNSRRINPPGAIERVPNRRGEPWDVHYEELRDMLIELQLEVVPINMQW